MKASKTPMISVIMSEYNTNPDYLHTSIKSILDQTFKDFEFVIIDDCGKNDVARIAKQFNDKRIRVIKNRQNSGLVYSLNVAVKHAKADYLVRMDTDDIALPKRLETLYNYVQEHPEYGVIGSRVFEFSDVEETNGVLGRKGEKTAKEITSGDAPIHPSVIMSKNAVVAVGGYPDYKRAEDFALWSELLLNACRIYVMDDILLYYRVNPSDYAKRRLRYRVDAIKARLRYYPQLRAPAASYLVFLKIVLSGMLPPKLVQEYRARHVLEESRSDTINILHVVAGMNRGGAETFLMNILRDIDRDKFNFIFLCYGDQPFDYEQEILSLGAKLVRIPDVKAAGVWLHIRDIRRVIRSEAIDIVHAHTYYNAFFSLIAAKLSGVRIRMAHSHNTRSETNPSFVKLLYFRISGLGINFLSTVRIACGYEAGRALFNKKPFIILNNGIPADSFVYRSEARKRVRRELHIRGGTQVMLHIGRLEVVKNHTFLLKVFKAYIVKHTDSKLLIVGGGPLEKDIKKEAGLLGVADKVILLGKRADIPHIMSAADVFVFPSLFEGLPLVLIEAQANGLPCVVSDGVPSEANISGTLKYMPLEKPIEEWVDVIDSSIGSRSENGVEVVKSSGYDVANTAILISEIYIGELNKKK